MAIPYVRTPHLWAKDLRWRSPKTRSSGHYVFIQGTPRSGTTLLQSILGSHSQLANQQRETGLFTLQSIFGRQHFDLNTTELKLLFKTSCDLVDFFDRGIAMVLDNPHQRFVEKTPQHILRLPMLVYHFPESKFVHMVRDGRDCFCSARNHPGIPQRFNIHIFARYWRRCIRKRLMVADSPKVYDLRYEQLVHDPEKELNALMAFLDLKLEASQLDPSIYGRDSRAALDNHRRLSQPIQDTSVERWRHELSDREKSIFLRICSAELRAYGYDTS